MFPPPILPDDQIITGPWRLVGKEVVVPRTIPVTVQGLSSAPVVVQQMHVYVNVERRPVWKFIGYEERTTES